MVGLNFDARFEVAIREGWKTQTIRKVHPRNPRPGDVLQLFTGQRSPECRRLCPDVRCTDVLKIEITFGDDGGIDRIVADGVPARDLDAFAVQDGFADSDDMAAFWREKHGLLEVFHGVLIEWARPMNAERAAA